MLSRPVTLDVYGDWVPETVEDPLPEPVARNVLVPLHGVTGVLASTNVQSPRQCRQSATGYRCSSQQFVDLSARWLAAVLADRLPHGR